MRNLKIAKITRRVLSFAFFISIVSQAEQRSTQALEFNLINSEPIDTVMDSKGEPNEISPAILKFIDQSFSGNRLLNPNLEFVNGGLKKDPLQDAKKRITDYLSGLKISDKPELLKETYLRLLGSSPMFILCEDSTDWTCLESDSPMKATKEYRRESKTKLGEPVFVDDKLQMKVFFTRVWADKMRGKDFSKNKMLAQVLGESIREFGADKIYMALYGIDDVGGTMAPVYQSLLEAKKQGTKVYGVFDVSSESDANAFLREYDVRINNQNVNISAVKQIDFSYFIKNIKGNNILNWAWGRPTWMDDILSFGLIDPSLIKGDQVSKKIVEDVVWLSKNPEKNKLASRLAFQYSDTKNLILQLNEGISSNEAATARIEYPFQRIMHNKYFVFENKGSRYIWTGTANVAQTCMGDESNSNMAVLIKSNAVAQAFVDEFDEMYGNMGRATIRENYQGLLTGFFHQKKRPNSKRYFVFKDGHELRVHFSPTDDAEHRAIIPMVNSAQSGDILRISMFGAGGIELVRALQMAAARGVDIRIVLDRFTGGTETGWLKDPNGNLLDKNPYSGKLKLPIKIRLSRWPGGGLNHYKAASLTRLEGKSYRPELLTVGSQNWSISGNDENDENMITVRHLEKSLQWAAEFNEEFDNNLWELAEEAPAKKTNL